MVQPQAVIKEEGPPNVKCTEESHHRADAQVEQGNHGESQTLSGVHDRGDGCCCMKGKKIVSVHICFHLFLFMGKKMDGLFFRKKG